MNPFEVVSYDILFVGWSDGGNDLDPESKAGDSGIQKHGQE